MIASPMDFAEVLTGRGYSVYLAHNALEAVDSALRSRRDHANAKR